MTAATLNEETLVIETPERVPLHFALASTGNRFLACAIDHAIQTSAIGLMVLLLAVGGFFNFNASALKAAPKWVVALFIIIIFIVWTGYFALFETVWSGQTPGKRLMRLRVIREDGRPVTFWEAAARNLIRLFDMMPFPFYSIGLVAVFASSRDQRIGDFVAGTVVVREREDEAPTFAEVFNSPTSDVAMRRAFAPVVFSGDANVLTEDEIEVIETFLRRRWDLKDQTRQWMAWRVATPVLYKIRPAFDHETFTYEGFLEELLHRYRATHRFKN